MEYKEQEGYTPEHITPLFSALDSSYEGSSVFSSCERPCVCVCVCKHGKSSSLDFQRTKDLEGSTEELFKESLAA